MQAVEILASAMATDFPSTFEEKSCIKVVGADMTKNAAAKIYREAGLGPQDVQVVELHDCFSCNEVPPPFPPRSVKIVQPSKREVLFVNRACFSSSHMKRWVLLARVRQPSSSTPATTPTVLTFNNTNK